MPKTPPRKARRASHTAKKRGVGRPAGLSRDAILDSALRVVQRQGLDKLTVRRLAQQAGVTPMAVYYYFEDKEEIILAVIDRVVADAAVTEHGIDPSEWREWLLATFHGIYQTLVSQPGVIPLLANSLLYGPAALSVLDDVVKVLRNAGFDGPAAARGVHAIASYTVGAAQLQAGAGSQGTNLLDASIESASADAWPNLIENAGHMITLSHSDPFAPGLCLLLKGLVVANS